MIELNTAYDAPFDECLAIFASIEGVDAPLHVYVSVVDEDEMRAINRENRGFDHPTDVLSFPTISCKNGTLRNNIARLKREYDPEVHAHRLGDIFICLPVAKRQAFEYGHTVWREVAYLFTHGLLHLCGYDHETQHQKNAMRAQEEAILTAAGLPPREGAFMNDSALMESAKNAAQNAYAPYSKYAVGACLLALDGRVFTGCNVENAAYGVCLCAERNALGRAILGGARRFSAIAVYAAGDPPWPCGMCRQALYEFSPDMRVIVAIKDGVLVRPLNELLPEGFGFTEVNQ